MKTPSAIALSLLAAAAFGGADTVRLPTGWADASGIVRDGSAPSVSVKPLHSSLRNLVSRDGFVEVFSDEKGPEDGTGYKVPVFESAVDEVERISRVSGLAMPHGAAGLVVHVGDGTNADARVVVRIERGRAGSLLTRLYLPSPCSTDLDAFTRQIAAAYLRAWTSRTADAAAGGKRAPFKEAPEWAAHGLSRAADEEFALFDKLDALDMWQSGGMPFFPKMPAELDFGTDRGSALCGFMVKWMTSARTLREGRDGSFGDPAKGGTVFAGMMERLAKDKEWDDGEAIAMLTGETDPHAQDAAFDAHMWKLRRSVLVPGRSTPEDIRAFSSRLLLYPPFFDISFPGGLKACPFRLAIRSASDPVVRVSAFAKSRSLELTVIGRGEGLVKAAESYVRFLKALAAGEPKDSLTERLDEADALLGAAYKEAVETFGT